MATSLPKRSFGINAGFHFFSDRISPLGERLSHSRRLSKLGSSSILLLPDLVLANRGVASDEPNRIGN